MITAELLNQTWAESFKGRRPFDVLTLVGFELPPLDEDEEWDEPELNELEQAVADLAMYVASKAEGHPVSVFATGIALGYLMANREALELAS